LATDPDERPSEHEILSILGVSRLSEPGLSLTAEDGDEPPFLGRSQALQQLDLAAERARNGQAVAVHVTGPAGIGKSALVAEWLRRGPNQTALVLSGRCHERESVPYKAFDALIDSLTRWMLRQEDEPLSRLLPADIAALAALFPVLQRVPMVAKASTRDLELLDKRGVRRRAFTVWKQLMRRLCAEQPVVLVLDDLQWADLDSVELLATLLQGQDAPPVLACLLYRAEDIRLSSALTGLRKLAPPLADFAAIEQALPPLSQQEAQALALQMLQRQHDHDPATVKKRAEIIAKESQGSPLFATELVRFRDDRAQTGQSSINAPQVSLEELLLARVAGLPPSARTLLDFVAMAGKPTAQGAVLRAADLGRDARAALARLRSGHFVRTAGDGDRDTVETFHNRIREVLLGSLSADQQRVLHLQLGEALLADGELAPDAVALAQHFQGGGDDVRGLHWGLVAARQAHAVHANREAVLHYDAVLAILDRQESPDSQDQQLQVRQEAAEAARQAGLYDKALVLVRHGLAAAQTELAQADGHVNLGRVLQEMGNSDAALVELETGLRLYGRPPPANLLMLGLQVAEQWLVHFAYTLFPSLAKRADEDPTLKKRLDTMFALIRIYYFIDVAKVTWAGLHTINLSRRLAKEENRSLAFSFYGVMMMGIAQLPRSQRWCEAGLTLARKVGSPVAEAVALSRLGTQANFANELDRADRTLRDACDLFQSVGEMWELQTALMMLATTRFMSSDFRGAEPMYTELGAYGVELNAVMFQGWSKSWAPFCRYLVGEQDAESVLRELEEATELSARAKDVANTAAALMHMAAVAIREGQVERSAGLAVRTFECIDHYLVQVPFLQAALVDAGDAALLAVEKGAMSVPRGRLLQIARKSWKKARRMSGHYTYLLGPSLRLQARYVQVTQGAAAAESLFDNAISVLERTPNRWETAVALLEASHALPARRDDLRRRARKIIEEIGAVVELRRL
jgi:tetratricopeptide (TPR) repeat protein